MTRDEILALSKMSEIEQRKLLASNGILKQTVQEFAGSEPRALVYYESLPDLADRLWREANNKYYRKLLEAMELVFDKSGVNDSFSGFWMCDALPIHRIQAALLAKKFQK